MEFISNILLLITDKKSAIKASVFYFFTLSAIYLFVFYIVQTNNIPADSISYFELLTALILIFTSTSIIYWLLILNIKNYQKSTIYHQLLFQDNPIGLALCKLNGDLVEINPKYAEMLGREKNEVLKLSYWDITPDKYQEEEVDRLKELKETGRYSGYEKEYIHKDGHLINVRLNGNLVEYENETMIWSCIEDITENKKQEADEKSRQLKIIEYNQCLAELIKHPLFINGHFEEMLPILTETVSKVLNIERVSIWFLEDDSSAIYCVDLWSSIDSKHTKGFILTHADFPKYFEAMLNDRTLCAIDVYTDPRTREFTKSYFPENKICSMLDAPFHFEGITKGLLCLEKMNEIHHWSVEEETFIISVTDIISLIYATSHRKELELSLRRSEKMDALGKLTGGIAHDYNNMLAVIMGYTQVLLQRFDIESFEGKRLDKILYSAKRSSELTKKLPRFSTVKSDISIATDINMRLNDIVPLIEKSLTPTHPFNLNLTSEKAYSLINSGEFEDVILNLAINARHAMQPGGSFNITTSIENLTQHESAPLSISSGKYIKVSVEDEGCGMDNDTQLRIFDPFYTTKGDEGTGLGLTQVYGFVTRSQGAIKVDSELNQGSTFTIYLPFHDKTLTNTQLTDDVQSVIPKGNNELILVVDDEADLRLLTQEILEEHGYKTLSAKNGIEALDYIASNSIELVITDVIMPKMTGIELIKHLEKSDKNIPVILVSGHTRTKNIPENQIVLYKPFDDIDLLKTVQLTFLST